MKIKHFTASTMADAMSQIRLEMGKDAIIIATENNSDGVKVTAALESSQEFKFDQNDKIDISPSLIKYDDMRIRESLEYHNVLPEVKKQILAFARQIHSETGQNDSFKLLADTFKRMYGFCQLLENGTGSKIFMGMPGCGKSTVIAKVATKAVFKKIKTAIISADNIRAGANVQLKTFAEILKTGFYCCKTAKELFSCVKKNQSEYQLLLIDTPGINPYDEADVDLLEELTDSLKADKILVTDAGRDTYEAVESTNVFCDLGTNIILPTHLDMTRRIGAVISNAYCHQLTFCAGSVSANIAKGLADITPKNLAKLLLTE